MHFLLTCEMHGFVTRCAEQNRLTHDGRLENAMNYTVPCQTYSFFLLIPEAMLLLELEFALKALMY